MRHLGPLQPALNYLIKLRFIIDRLELRKRILLLTTTLVVLVGLWFLLLYLPQKSAIADTREAIESERKEAASLIQQRAAIENLIKDDTVQKLTARYERLKEQMKALEEKAERYQHRFIGHKELANLLHSMLKQTPGVTIEHFAIATKKGIPGQQDPPSTTMPANNTTQTTGAPATTGAPDSSIPAVSSSPVKQPASRVQYTLTLNGDYFAIMNYLKQLEQLEWQLYWDKLDYQVQTYPAAKATVEFYTLRPQSQQQTTAGGNE